jgi:hypothetical protein
MDFAGYVQYFFPPLTLTTVFMCLTFDVSSSSTGYTRLSIYTVFLLQLKQ